MPEMGDDVSVPSASPQGAQPKSEKKILRRWRAFFQSQAPCSPAPKGGLQPSVENLYEKRVADIAIPKVSISAVPLDIHKDALIEVFRESGLSRLPVYDGTLDKPAGLIHLKDFALHHGFNGNNKRFSIEPLLRSLLFVPPSMSIGTLLQKMQAERLHMALVVDEYGGVDGLVTIEDLIEQVLGEIEDEHDPDDDQFWKKERPGVYIAAAQTRLDEFENEIGISLSTGEEDDADTLGGLVFVLAGHVPVRGEIILHPRGVEFEIVDADVRRVKQLRVFLDGQNKG